MLKFVIDEDLPRSTGITLKENGYDVLDVRDHGLRGESDEKIYKYAQKNEAVVLTGHCWLKAALCVSPYFFFRCLIA